MPVRLVSTPPPHQSDSSPTREAALVESYRRLADVFHDILAEQSLDSLLERIADTFADLIPHDTLTVYEVDELQRQLRPVLARDEWAEKIMRSFVTVGEGITGWAAAHREPVRVNQAHLDPRVKFVPGTPPDEPEALISIPLIAREQLKGVLNVYRLGEFAAFDDDEFELAKRFADAAALALDNAHIRARLEHQAQTDSLTGLFNHRYFHERLRTELVQASRSHAPVGVLMLDIDDFKKVNDVYGHGTGDEILRELAEALRGMVRARDVVCRLGGEEFGVIMVDCDESKAIRLAGRLTDGLSQLAFDPAGRITVSVGIAQGPRHAMNPRELVTCAEAAMMTAKARGKNQIVFFDEGETGERPHPGDGERDVRSIAHLKMLQSLSGKLNRLNDVREIGLVIANELRSLIDYHNCRVFVIEGEDVVPIAFRGGFATHTPTTMDVLSCKIGQGITGRVAETGESLLVGDASNCEFAQIIPGTTPIDESLLVVPLRYSARVTGVIVISKLGLDQFDEDDMRLLEVLGGHASVALENARLYEAERREAQMATALLDFSRQLAGASGLEEILDRVVELSASMLGSDRASFWLQEPETGDVLPRAIWGFDPEGTEGIMLRRIPPDLLAGRTEPFVADPLDVERVTGRPAEDGYVVAVAPLAVEGGRLGCIVTVTPDEGTGCGDRELRLMAGLAHQAKLAITNAGSYESLEETFLSTVEALANALEANDEYTSSHARWITDLALKVGGRLGLEGPALKHLELGALFHDIGKIGIPSTVLHKPGPLTREERTVIERHPELGERIIGPIERLESVRPIVRHCHERFDGAGYPDGLSGDAIPLESRIIFVCDAFHAMTTDRPYRKRLTGDEALRRLEEGAGAQFDPRVVEVCVDVLREELGLDADAA